MKIVRVGAGAALVGRVDARMMDLSRRMIGQKRWVQGTLRFAVTADNIEAINETYPGLDWSEFSEALQALEAEAARRARALELRHGALPEDTSGYEFKTKPYDHQSRAWFMSRDMPAFALLMEMGTGKSKLLVDTAAFLHKKGEVDTVLIVAPNGVHRQWINEQIPAHWPDNIPQNAWFWGSKELPKAAKILESGSCQIVAMNIEGLSRTGSPAQKFAAELVKGSRTMLVVDESSRIKNHGSKRAKFLTALGKLCPYRRILTGTSVTQGIEDLYSQFLSLDQNILGHRSMTTFRADYCVMGGFQNKKVVAYKNIERLQQRIDPYSFIIKKADCLDLPPKIYMTREVEWKQEQRSHYDRLLDDFWTKFDTGEFLGVDQAITQLIRLQQVLGGFLQDGDHIQRLDNSRVDTCVEAVEDLGGKVIVFARFREELRMLEEAFAGRCASYHGGVSQDQKEANIDRFKTDPAIKVFLANQQSAGLGLNLTEATGVVYYSHGWSLEERLQSEDRAHRIGQHHPVTYIDLKIPGTMEERILKALARKLSVSKMVLDDLRWVVFGEAAPTGGRAGL